MAWAWVIIGSGLGGMARYAISGAVARRIGETFPWGTLAVNVSGSFVIGVFAALVAPGAALAGQHMAGAFAMAGLCGGYTTFSSFSLQTLNLARDHHLAGATVLRGPMGFGHSSRLHTAKVLRLSEDLPVVVEIVDSEEKINAFLPLLDAMMASGLVTMEKVQVLQYGARAKG